jgi:hypothetical protein
LERRGAVGAATSIIILKHPADLFRLVLAEYDVKYCEIQGRNYEAVGDKCDIHFHPEYCRKELEVSFICLVQEFTDSNTHAAMG